VHKIVSNCILSNTKEAIEFVIQEYQSGFKIGRSTTYQIFIFEQLIQKIWEFKKKIHGFFY